MKSFLLFFTLLGLMAAAHALGNDPIISDNCTVIDNCELCLNSSCHWLQCINDDPSCQDNPESEMCHDVPCTIPTTVAPPTEPPTEPPTTEAPATTTPAPTEPPTPPPTEPPTTEAPTEPPTEAPTTQPPTTEAPTRPLLRHLQHSLRPQKPPPEPPTEAPTTLPPATTTEKPCPTPDGRHFDAPSFFGGMVLAVGILAVAYAAWRFYKSRNERNYHTLQTVY
ncbi:gibberellin-regulated protein 14-like isoform X2 [Penaeus japonicus]|uniref:gibberellin-regulated protein 14-like isoform X2 n=1 Tax=Penaeus japonicus TaxID=27405 RepID=UPI001C715A93|nr:gibberellin-regulated protein 14-like isoform X2 [Penaeus japonicus]